MLKCWICGADATTTKTGYEKGTCGDGWFWAEPKPTKYKRCYCDKCAERVREQERKEEQEYIRLKKRRMFLRACDILENQHTDMYKYKEAIEAVEEHISVHPDKYDSAYEVLAAIVLVHERIHVKMQQKIGRYQVDFIIPELLVILEIDGDRHKHRKAYDNRRDNKIKSIVGDAWEIIRINTEYLDQNAKALPNAIDKVLEHRNKTN